ncbi:MAG: hypothetical protein KKH88_00890 [Nanoarchaeota archaeon]|nr:hypothetical protein [Nanoarchaeota archaeon]MBU1444720.1 hypothetical protein [Nanoarchaeota archaeon]MBU2406885.1 hypothetical protein [Nanoarchaeota archaeon]MBU2420784.1 hypothetical protein [Nanoarchaeota archaeon]MBU2475381.1 hypothetical protein [Nanoarchaeota archaeon]
MKKLLLLTIILFILSNVNATTIHGGIYDFNLDLLENTIIEIDTTPKQSIVAKDAYYSFEVPEGSYILSASYSEEGYILYEIDEEIQVVGDGDYVFDLILLPAIDDDFYQWVDFDVDNPYSGESFNYWWAIIIIIVVILLIILFLKKEPKPILEGDISDKVLEIIKKQGGRTTQKEIRKQIPMSEAKISLVISELEHKGILKKIKKGRGNIIILEKR